MDGTVKRLVGALRSWFEPLVEKSSKRPIALADGLASIIAVLLIVLLGALLPGSFDWVVTGIVITLLALFVWMDWDKRHA